MTRNRVTWFLVVVMVLGVFAASAYAQASQAAWRFDPLIGLSAANSGGAVTDTGWQSILTTHIKTPNAKELAIGVSLQCGIVTDTTVKSKEAVIDSSAARARIRVRVRITQPDTTVVFAQPSNGGDLSNDIAFTNDGVTFCDRYQKLEAKFAGLNCTADLGTGIVTCQNPESLRLLLQTLNANHFNFIHANAVPGVHKVEVQARAQAGILLGGSSLGAAGAEAFVGAGVLSVQVIRLVKDAAGTTDLTDLK